MGLFLLLGSASAQQISVTTLLQTYFQDFNTLANSGSTGTSLPNGWYTNVVGGTYRVGNGSSATGGVYSLGDTSGASQNDRALGSLGSGGSPNGQFAVKFVNNTGATITKINLHYMLEEWRLGQKPAVRLDSLVLSYNVDVDSIQATGWSNYPPATMFTPDTSGVGGSRNGNVPPNRALHEHSLDGLNIPDGSNFWIRWADNNIIGNDDALGIDSLTITFEGAVLPPCIQPLSAVTNVELHATGITSVAGSFGGTIPVSDGYLVLVDSTSNTPVVADGATYNTGSTVGTAIVASNGPSTTFSLSGLVANTIYTAYVIPYNTTLCSGGPNYNPIDIQSDTAKTLFDACPEPTAEPTNLIFTSVTKSTIAGKFNKAVPAPTGGYVVVFSKSSNVGYPVDSTVYNAGDSVIVGSFKSEVAYVGTDSNFTISGLDSSTRYYVAVVPYNLCVAIPNYNRTTPLRDDTITAGVVPLQNCTQPSGISTSTVTKDSTQTTITVTFTFPPSADSVMVLAGTNAGIGFADVRDSVYYGVGTTIPGSGAKVYYRGTGDSVTITGLTSNTVYKILFVSFNNSGCANGPNYSAVGSVTVKTAAGAPGDCGQPSGVSNNSITKTDSTATTISIHFTVPGNADSVMVLAGPNGTIGFVDIRDSVYYAVGTTIPGSGAKVYARGSKTDSSVVLTGLTPNTVYKILIATFNNIACNFGPNYSGPATITVKTALSTGIRNKNTEADFALYPNPAGNGLLNIKFKNILKEEAIIEILDVTGRQLHMQKANVVNDIQTINVSSLAKGTYLLNVIYKGTDNVSTFIIE
jgi:hypothetical protein